MKNQFGFFTLEIILVVMIISLLATVAVPNMHKMLDTARLDYEIKKFCSEFDFAHALGKQASVKAEIFDGTFSADKDSRTIAISIDEKNRAYQLLRGSTSGYNPIREKHFLSDGIKINSTVKRILFSADGRLVNDTGGAISNSFYFTSSYVIKPFEMNVDSVGRWRGKRS